MFPVFFVERNLLAFLALSLAMCCRVDADDHSALLHLLQNGEPQQRIDAARTLSQSSSIVGDAKAIDTLIGILESGNPLDQSRAAVVLGNAGKGDADVAKKLIEASFSDNDLVSKSCLEALLRIDAPSEVTMAMWVQMLKQQDYDAIMHVVHAMSDLGPRAVPKLKDALKHPEVAYWACLIAGEIGPDAAAVAPELVALSMHESGEIQLQAIVALGGIAGDASIVVPALSSVLKDDMDLAAKYAASYALSQYVGNAAALAAVETAFDSTQDTLLKVISGWSVLSIDERNPRREQAVIAILNGLSSKDAQIRQLSVRALADIKPSKAGPSTQIIQALDKALRDSDSNVVAQVMDALVRKGVDSLPLIPAILKDKQLKHYAVELARRIGPSASPVVPSLVQELKDSEADPQLTRELHYAIGTIGACTDECLDTLKVGLDSENNEVRYSACYAIGKLGESAQSLSPEVKALLDNQDEFTQTAAVWTLIQIGSLDGNLVDKAVGLLTAALENDNDGIRSESAKALGRLGPRAAAAVPALKRWRTTKAKTFEQQPVTH